MKHGLYVDHGRKQGDRIGPAPRIVYTEVVEFYSGMAVPVSRKRASL